jgi:hypothetical protein
MVSIGRVNIRTLRMEQNLRGALQKRIREHLHQAAEVGYRRWINYRSRTDNIAGDLSQQSPEQSACIYEIVDWTAMIAGNCQIDIEYNGMKRLQQQLVTDKEVAKDGTINPANYERRWAAFYATFKFLVEITSPDSIAQGIPQPRNMEELLSVADGACRAFYAVKRKEELNVVHAFPAENFAAIQNSILMPFMELLRESPEDASR